MRLRSSLEGVRCDDSGLLLQRELDIKVPWMAEAQDVSIVNLGYTVVVALQRFCVDIGSTPNTKGSSVLRQRAALHR